MKKKKNRPEPKRGDQVRLIGREPFGILRTIDDELSWAVVEWDKSAPQGPRYVHMKELIVVAETHDR